MSERDLLKEFSIITEDPNGGNAPSGTGVGGVNLQNIEKLKSGIAALFTTIGAKGFKIQKIDKPALNAPLSATVSIGSINYVITIAPPQKG